jgi:rRNA pseudouridine-1189 N-methylase Emg1 (Nep1/Mra1 family)
MAHSVNTVNTACFFKEVQQARNRFTATYFALHAMQKSILLSEKAVVIIIHWVSTICEKEPNTCT